MIKYLIIAGSILTWACTPAHAQRVNTDELQCAALNIYHEARGEATAGQVAVALVVKNRVLDQRYPNTYCEVVHDGPLTESWKTRQYKDLPDHQRVYYPKRHKCQFSWYCDGKSDKPKDVEAFKLAWTIAWQVMTDRFSDITDGSTHYHALHVDPHWNDHMKYTLTINNHKFYRQDR